MKLPTSKEKEIVRDMAMGLTDAEIERKYDIAHATANNARKRNIVEIETRKKAVLEKSKDSDADAMLKIADEFQEIIKLAQAQVRLKLPEASAAQAAIIGGIAADKRAMILGQPGQTLNVRFESRNDMIVFLRGVEPPKPHDSKPILSLPVKDTSQEHNPDSV